MTDLVHGGTELVAGQPVVQIVAHEGYPLYVLTILGVWKLLGGITWASPSVSSAEASGRMPASSSRLTGALVSGIVRGGDPGTIIWSPLILAALAVASWALRPPGRILGVLFPARTLA